MVADASENGTTSVGEPPPQEASREDPSPSPGALQWLDEHLNVIRAEIIADARKIADARPTAAGERVDILPRDIVDATGNYAPGERIAPPRGVIAEFISRVTASITGVTIVSALLAFAFGLIGFWVATHTVSPLEQLSSGAFDIAKIFAGAIVGSTTATVAANMK